MTQWFKINEGKRVINGYHSAPRLDEAIYQVAGTDLERWMLIRNQKVIHKDGGQGTVDKIWIEQNRIVFSVKFYDQKAPNGTARQKGEFIAGLHLFGAS